MGYRHLPFLLVSYFLCHLAFSSSIPQLCPKDQSLALIEFNQTLVVEAPSFTSSTCDFNSQKFFPRSTSSWNISEDCCLWDGVVCDEFTGHVIELDLGCSQLRGKIDSDSSLFQLSHLQRLDLSRNNFSHSQISPKFGRLSSLTHLDLSYSHFSGHIPSEISHLSKLQSLHLSSDSPLFFDDELKLAAHDFKLLLQNLTQLRELDLSGVEISSTIPPNFSSHLTTLWLRSSGLYGIIPESIFHLPNLEVLNLDDNNELGGHFPKTKWNNSASLRELSLSGVNFSGDLLPESLGYLTSLRYLLLYSCSLSGSIPRSLWNLTHIEYLILGNNHLEGSLPLFTSGLQNLSQLSLSNNYLNGEIPFWIFSLPSLGALDLGFNNFSGQLKDFKHNTLDEIDFSNNQLQGPLPNSIQNLVNLKRLSLSSNHFSGNVDVSLFSNIKQLSLLDLSFNNISLTNEKKPKSTLPESLRYLLLAACEVNELNFLRSVGQLQQLDLSHNNLKGAIPQCLGNMSDQLEVLDMQHNSLSGDLQATFSFESKLKSFNLHGNKLEGKIPRSLANCKELEVLDLGNNHLNDTFPMWLGTLPKLQVLSLRSNKLHGPIRHSRIKNLFPQLQLLDLSCNAFTAELPRSLFQNLEGMRRTNQTLKPPTDGYYQDSVTVVTKGLELEVVRILFLYTTMDLSRNKFEGQIPSMMGDLIALRVLNLSHNGLQGHIPTSLGKLSDVESLDLSFNKLSGEIPQQIASLTSLAVLNLSHNHLEGCIPGGPQFATFDNNSYEHNDGLRGFPVSEDCRSSWRPETNSADEESDSSFLSELSWKVVLIGYGCGLFIGFCIAYFMFSSRNPNWLSWIAEELEYNIKMRRRKRQRGQGHYRRRRRRNNGV